MAASQERLSPGLRRPVPWTLLSYGTLESVNYICANSHSTQALALAFSCFATCESVFVADHVK